MSKVNRKDGPSEESGPVTHMIMMPKESLSPATNVELSTIQVYHPRNDSTVLFVRGGQFFEVQKTQIAKYGSWFLDQRRIPVADTGLVVARCWCHLNLKLTVVTQIVGSFRK